LYCEFAIVFELWYDIRDMKLWYVLKFCLYRIVDVWYCN